MGSNESMEQQEVTPEEVAEVRTRAKKLEDISTLMLIAVMGTGTVMCFLYFAVHLVRVCWLKWKNRRKKRKEPDAGRTKNTTTDNLGLGLSFLGIIFFAVQFTEWFSFQFFHDEYFTWKNSHRHGHRWFLWSGSTALLIKSWLFNMRYV